MCKAHDKVFPKKRIAVYQETVNEFFWIYNGSKFLRGFVANRSCRFQMAGFGRMGR